MNRCNWYRNSGNRWEMFCCKRDLVLCVQTFTFPVNLTSGAQKVETKSTGLCKKFFFRRKQHILFVQCSPRPHPLQLPTSKYLFMCVCVYMHACMHMGTWARMCACKRACACACVCAGIMLTFLHASTSDFTISLWQWERLCMLPNPCFLNKLVPLC